MTEMSYSARFTQLAAERPAHAMVTLVEPSGAPVASITWGEMERASNRLAHKFVAAGVVIGDYVTIALPNSVEFFTACIAAWKVGATPQPVSSRLPSKELDAIVDLANPKVVCTLDEAAANAATHTGRVHLGLSELAGSGGDSSPLPDAIAPSWKAPTSGGSTGRPKLIVASDPSVYDQEPDTDFAAILRIGPWATTVVPGPMYHNGPFVWAFTQLLKGGHVVLLVRFDAQATLAAIERYQGNALYLVPTMMSRIWKLPVNVRQRFDMSSLGVVWHLAAPCPAWLKKEWIDWLGPDRIWELYGGTEGQSATIISGTEWLAHEGSVGRPVMGEMRIVDEHGDECPAGTVGEVFMRPEPGKVTYRYVGAEPTVLTGGWESLGDMGWMDGDGFLYLADRRSDMILSGGANIYPAEVESELESHPAVRSCAVIGLPDSDLGQRVHAVVQAVNVSSEELVAHVAEQLVRYKVPRSIEFVTEAVRDDAGKVRRSALLAQRRERPQE